MGSSGAWAEPAADATSPSSRDGRDVDFLRDVVPVLSKAGCNGGKCHGSFQGRGDFQLSLLGFDPSFDYEALVKRARGRRVNAAAPDQSLVLRKALAEMPHGGGKRFERTSEFHRILERWIEHGAPPPADGQLAVEALVVEPAELILQQDQQASLQVKAIWSDGVEQDVTRRVLYEVRDEMRAEVSGDGEVHAVSPGRTAVTITFLGQVAAVTVTVPYPAQLTGLPSAEGTPSWSAFESGSYIDQLVAAEWKKLGVQPAPLADDSEFVRRIYLDLIGTLPTPVEVRDFVESDEQDKRAKLIDQLLEREEYVDYWSTRWADLLRVHRRYVGEKGLWSFWGWVRQAVRENRPVDKMVRELVTSRGSLFSNGATAFYYVDSEPEQLAETASQLFLGVRLQCARCHHHPYEIWSQDDYYGLASFFTRIELKDNGDNGRYGGAKLLRPIDRVNKKRRIAKKVPPRAFGHEVEVVAEEDVRVALADWITCRDNPYFARNFANRFWSYMMGRGLVEPVDDLRATNPASHPALLDQLAKDFEEHDYDPKYLLRTICNSRVYQLASDSLPQQDAEGMFYTYRRYQRIPAAVLLDALNQVCGTNEQFDGLPAGTRAISLPDPAIRSYFLDAFGRSVRNSPCECATSSDPDLAQALHLINSDDFQKKIGSSSGRIAELVDSSADDQAVIEDLYLAAFGRSPTLREQQAAGQLVQEGRDEEGNSQSERARRRQQNFEDLLWALLNSTEFVFNH